MSDLKLVDMRSYRTIDDLGPEERNKVLVEFYTARMLQHLEEERAAKARLVWTRELSLGAETRHIEWRTDALIEREKVLQASRATLVEVRQLGEWHAKQAQLHAEAAERCRSRKARP
jgi:hypothetical protein